MAKFNLSLLSLTLVLALAVSSNADAFGPHRRDHANLGRLVKKRSPADEPTQSPGSSAVAQTTPGGSTSVQATSDHASASASPSPSTSNGGLLGSVLSDVLPTGSSATSAVSTMSATSDHPSNTQTSAQASQAATEGPTPSGTQSILYLTMSHTPTPTQTSSSSGDSSSSMSHAAMTVIIVIAASVGAAVIVWTIIRKWKFRPSSDFEGRMQPIDWQPGGNDEDAGLPGQHSLSRASSFHSGSASGHADDQMRGPVGGYGASQQLNPLPDHDFTAGPAHFAPVGGYADLARGPSPQPIMQESFSHAPSMNRPVQYDQYGVPLHHGYNGY